MAQSTPYSISVRLRRVTMECARVQVPVDDTVMKMGTEVEGFRRLDLEKVMAAAVKIGSEPSVVWEPESGPDIAPHPVQSPLGELAPLPPE